MTLDLTVCFYIVGVRWLMTILSLKKGILTLHTLHKNIKTVHINEVPYVVW